MKHHVETLCPRLNGTLMFLNGTKKQPDFKYMLLVLNTLIFLHLINCPTISGIICKKTMLYDMKLCQNFTAKAAHDKNFT